MSLSQEDIDNIISLWKYSEQQADPTAEEDQAISGLRKTDLLSCQYWLKGLSPICNYWVAESEGEDERCTFETPKNQQGPSAYNGGNCDYLGRKSICSRYEASEEEDLEEYFCILPNIFLSGVGKASGTAVTGLTLTPIPKKEIKGYCDGKCDGYGRGTGCDGDPLSKPVVCNYFRPWQMGFGKLSPKDVKRTITKDGQIYIKPEDLEAAYKDVYTDFTYRRPLAFEIYNLRAEVNKCAYWNSDSGGSFEIDPNDGKISLDTDSSDPNEGCSNTDVNAVPYYTVDTPPSGTQQWILDEVWSQANTIVCNGAKPECPFYTGEWVYCNDINMLMGMRVTANQIFELRFWTSVWGSQDEYDKFFESKPNWQDVPTADIYTFKKWLKRGKTVSDSVALGQILHMCQPAPLNNRRFVPSDFLTATDIKYTAAGINMGTTAPNEGQVYYPTLIRNPYTEVDTWPIDIIYPYASMTPFSPEICGEPHKHLGIKRSSNIEGDTVSVIGTTIRNTDLYIFNLSMLEETLPEFNEHYNIGTISNIKSATTKDEGNFTGLSPREEFFLKLEDFIEYIKDTSPDQLVSVTSDSETGYFKSKTLNLKYNEINKIVVCGKFTNLVWDFRVRPVLSKLYGGLIVQNSFSQASEGRDVPRRFSPTATIEGKIYTLIDGSGSQGGSITPKCSLGEIVRVASNEYTNLLLSTSWLYSYCYKKITVEDRTIYNWTTIGNSGLIWAELEDTNINHLFEWGIVFAKMVYTKAEENETPTEIIMEEVEIESFVSGKRSVPPSACILKPKDSTLKKMFLNGDWDLKLNYWYKKISDNDSESEGKEIIWPDFSNDNITFSESNFSINIAEDNSFVISKIDNQTIALMGLFTDEEDRIISAMATKLLTWVVMLECRNVEINYKYSQPTNWYKLLPDTSTSTLAIPPAFEQLQGEYSPRWSRPPCGDHENGQTGTGKGPMWYPFNTCDQWDFYQAFAGANFCTNWYSECPRDDMRFCGPIKYTAFVAGGGGGSYADCVLLYHYRYSVTTGQAVFNGYANIVAHVNTDEYAAHGWVLPPFGNKGREMVNKWISQDHWIYLSLKDQGHPAVLDQWIPMVPDNTDFFFSFNAFDQSSVISPDGFTHINQLSFFKSNLLNEKIGTERKRFDDVYGSRGIWSASYPTPVVTLGQITKSIHYYFKDSNTTWAWQEYWKDVEYSGNEREFYFLTYEKPEYRYDYEKKEHRYICDEKIYNVKYKAPVITEDKMTKYPSLQLENGPERFFKIIYDTYGNESIEWADEGSGNVDGSKEEGEEENIYEVTSPNAPGSKWNHDENCLFDNSAVRKYSEADTAGRKVESLDGMGGLTEAYYNRGIIINLHKNNLKFLPYEETDNNLPFTVSPEANDSLGKGVYSWSPNTSPKIIIDLTTEELGTCISELKLIGQWGLHKIKVDKAISKRNIGVPGVTVVEKYDDGGSGTLSANEKVNYDEESYGDFGIVLYTLTFNLQPTVERMISKKATSMEIELDAGSNQYIFLDFVNLKRASYIDSAEFIQIYERMYITSTSTNFGSHNIDGPKVGNNFVLQHDLGGDTSGTYYAISPELQYVTDDPIQARDKMRGVYADEQYREKEHIDIDINNIEVVEQVEQMKLYNDAYNKDIDGDSLVYQFVTPPVLEYFIEKYGIDLKISDTLTFETKKAKWGSNYLTKSYKVGSGIWYPKGHKYQWTENITRKFCYEIDYMPEYGAHQRLLILSEPYFLHMDTLTGDVPSDPLTALYANRMLYQIQVAQKLFGDQAGFTEAGRIMGTAASFIDNSNVGDTGVITY